MREKIKGSYTIEAALIMPLVLGLLALTMQAAITCYQEVKTTAEETATTKEQQAVKVLYRLQTMEEFLGEWNEN